MGIKDFMSVRILHPSLPSVMGTGLAICLEMLFFALYAKTSAY